MKSFVVDLIDVEKEIKSIVLYNHYQNSSR